MAVVVVVVEADAAGPGRMVEGDVPDIPAPGKTRLLIRLLAPNDHDTPPVVCFWPVMMIFPNFSEGPVNRKGVRCRNQKSLEKL